MLETVWFILWGLLWAIYFMLDGFDLGAGMLMPWLARDERGRQAIYHGIEPYWDGNEVWLITAGGVTFAAFPEAYAVLFSALYGPLLMILFGLILRGAAVALRAETESKTAKNYWDACFILGSFVPTLLFGVAFANLLGGLPIDMDGRFHGTILTLLHPVGLLGGVLFVLLFAVHGALWLLVKGSEATSARAQKAARGLRHPLFAIVVIFWISIYATGRLDNASLGAAFPWIVLVVVAIPLALAWLAIGRGAWLRAWIASAATIALATLSLVIAMYPAIIPSSLDPEATRTIAQSASSPLTLQIMLVVALIMVPTVIAYQFWAYRFHRDSTQGY